MQNDPRLDTLLEFGAMCRKMISTTGKRVKQITRDTSLAIHQTCNGLVELTRHLLSTTHKYVVLGKFTTDRLEKAFSITPRLWGHLLHYGAANTREGKYPEN